MGPSCPRPDTVCPLQTHTGSKAHRAGEGLRVLSEVGRPGRGASCPSGLRDIMTWREAGRSPRKDGSFLTLPAGQAPGSPPPAGRSLQSHRCILKSKKLFFLFTNSFAHLGQFCSKLTWWQDPTPSRQRPMGPHPRHIQLCSHHLALDACPLGTCSLERCHHGPGCPDRKPSPHGPEPLWSRSVTFPLSGLWTRVRSLASHYDLALVITEHSGLPRAPDSSSGSPPGSSSLQLRAEPGPVFGFSLSFFGGVLSSPSP